MLTLYPPINAYTEHMLEVEKPHLIFVEECGNPKGLPILFVHGGPGAGCHENSRCFFDPKIFRIILFDQRGSGRSRPHAELQNNNTQALIADMEAIRKKLHINQWILFGGSWGSTLSLAYAERHPEKVLGLILRGIFLSRPKDLNWLYNTGASQVFPDHWQQFMELVPKNKTNDVIETYYKLLTGKDDIAKMHAAKNWVTWEANCATLEPNPHLIEAFNVPHVALSFARIGAHYFMNNCFLEPNQIITNINKIKNIPGIIVHGRYDMVCSLDNAWTLHQAWPSSELNIIRDAGHAASEPGIIDGLVRATLQIADKVRNSDL